MKASGVKLQSTKTGYRDRYFLPKFDERNVSTGSLIEVEVAYCTVWMKQTSMIEMA